jgi:iron complex outermembrane receptor protein
MSEHHDPSCTNPNSNKLAPLPRAVGIALLGLLIGTSAPALAQDTEEEADRGGSASVLMEEVTVTARKREEPGQQVPLSISAFSGQQIEALKVRTLEGLSVNMPNVAMDDIGTTRGVANFSIRGLGINSSIPGIDPTVGVFIDGVYLGQNGGVVFDMFDIESIEVLRGPQGTLFGRNVTGGAVLINTKKPTEEFSTSFRAAVDGNPNGDGGLNYYFMGDISGPLGDVFAGRLSVYHNEDKGWFENLYDGSDHGAASTTIFRPSIEWQPTQDFRLLARWEHQESDNDGPASQSHPNGLGIPGAFIQAYGPGSFDRDSHDFAIDEKGYLDLEVDHVNVQMDWDIDFGNGTITNIFGWRDYFGDTFGDIDGQDVWLFHSGSFTDYEQFSNELRYNGVFGSANVTTGIFWFSSDLSYSEGRRLGGFLTSNVAPYVTQDGGGLLDMESLAWFGAVDYDLNESWTLNAGLRYTDEDKDAQIASLSLNTVVLGAPKCTVLYGTCAYDFVDSDSWDAWSGKLGFTYQMGDSQRLYAHWSRGHRSGGYNLRNTSTDPSITPGPFDQETVDSYEIGYKSELGGRGRFNAAAFYTTIDEMQREINQSDPNAGVVQIITNSADAEIYGFELDGTFAFGRGTVLTASLGWVDPSYTFVRFDLNADGVVDARDEALKLPRAAEWTYSVGLNHDWEFDAGSILSGRISYAFRDDAFYTDNNLGYFLSQEILDAGLDFRTANSHWVFSIYGKNLLDDVNHGGDTQLPATLFGALPWGGTFSPLVKGRIVGLEVSWAY